MSCRINGKSSSRRRIGVEGRFESLVEVFWVGRHLLVMGQDDAARFFGKLKLDWNTLGRI